MTKTKKTGCGCLSILAIAAVAAGGLYYFRGNFVGKTLTPLEAAQAVPEEAYFTSFITTDSQDWSQLSQFGTPEAQEAISKNLEEMKADLYGESISYEEDIQPWLGGLMLAFLPSVSSEDPEMLMVAGIKNRLKARDFEQKIKQQPGQTVAETEYKGVTINTVTSKNNNSLTFAVMGSHLIVSNNLETVQNSIDTLKGESSFADKPGAKQAFSQRLNVKTPLATVYLVDYSALMQQFLNYTNTPIPPQTLQQLEEIQSIVIGIGVEKEGIRFQAVSKLNPDNSQTVLSNTPGKVLSLYPAKTFALVSGHGISQGWNTLVTRADNDPELRNAINQIRTGFSLANLDADQDIFGWMDGEFALGMVFSEQSNIPDLGIGGMIVLETSDMQTANNTLDKIGQLIEYQGLYVEKSQDVTHWKASPQETFISYSWLNNNALTMTIFMPFSVAKDVNSSNSLSQSANFKGITNSLPKNNSGYFYLDLAQARDEIVKIAESQGNSVDSETKAVLDSLQGFAVTLTMPDKNTSQFDMLLALKSSK